MEQRFVGPDEEGVQGIGFLAPEPTPHQVQHQNRDKCHRQNGREGHRIGLGIGKRTEEPEALTGQGKDGQEGDRDDEE